MPRQTREQVDAEIVDRAAALFARHGVQHTSLQQVADAVGYSKAGLLHHFPSKEAIGEAALHAAREMTTALVQRVLALPAGVERDRALVEELVDNALSRPGIAAFLTSLASNGPKAAPADLIESGLELSRAFDLAAGDLRIIQVLSATAGLQAAAEVAVRDGRGREWRPHIIATAMAALGHQPSD